MHRSFILCFFCFFSLLIYSQQLTLLFAGDAMQHQRQIDGAFRDGKYDYSSYFKYVTEEISYADLSIVNLEVTLGGTPYKGYPMFSAPDSFAVALKNAGFDVFLNANNHAIDRHTKGVERTIHVLDSLKVLHTGTFRNSEERERYYPLMVTRNGIRMAFLNYTYGTNGIELPPPCIVNYIDREEIKADIQAARKLGADIIIANVHWGLEYKLIQDKEQEDLARFLVNEGVGLVIGSHPHVVQPSQALTDSAGNISNVIVYSMGNFVSGMKVLNTDGGQMIKIILSKEEHKTRILSCAYRLVYMHKEKTEKGINYTLIPVTEAEKMKGPVIDQSAIDLDPESYRSMMIFAKNTRALFSKYNQGVTESSFENKDFWKDTLIKNMPRKFGE